MSTVYEVHKIDKTTGRLIEKSMQFKTREQADVEMEAWNRADWERTGAVTPFDKKEVVEVTA
jgi:hypothetical protein